MILHLNSVTTTCASSAAKAIQTESHVSSMIAIITLLGTILLKSSTMKPNINLIAQGLSSLFLEAKLN